MSKKMNWLTSLAGLGFLLGLVFFFAHRPVTFQSLESVTESGAPVFNQVQFLPGTTKDIWIMRQSHSGPDTKKNSWDRLAIVVDKNSHNAKFYQLKSGELAADLDQAVPLKARCYACHSNGPRAVRPTSGLGLADWLTVAVMNLRIKSYGRLQSEAGVDLAGGVHFKSPLGLLQSPLNLSSCTKCHSETGIRAALTFEHLGTIKFLTQKGQMPPFPFQLSEAERAQIERLTL